jgi:hypothetical protein
VEGCRRKGIYPMTMGNVYCNHPDERCLAGSSAPGTRILKKSAKTAFFALLFHEFPYITSSSGEIWRPDVKIDRLSGAY